MSHAAEYPVEHTANSPTGGPGAVAIVVAAVFGTLLWFTVAFQVLFIVPRFDKVFADFRLKLPLMTEWVIRDTWWFSLGCLLVVLSLCISRRSRWAGIILLVVVPLIINLIIVAGLYFPYVALAEGLGGNAPQW
jgi:hypothetical protein